MNKLFLRIYGFIVLAFLATRLVWVLILGHQTVLEQITHADGFEIFLFCMALLFIFLGFKKSKKKEADIQIKGNTLKIIEGSYLGQANIKFVPNNSSNGGFLRTYFKYQSGQEEKTENKCVVLTKDNKIIALKGPFDTVLPYEDVLNSFNKELNPDEVFDESMNIARNAEIPDGKYYLYLAEKA